MVSNTREIALEQAIQKHLTGHTTEELAGQPAPVGSAPYRIGLPGDFNAQFALDTAMFWQFLHAAQGKELAKLESRNPSDWQAKILERFDRMIKKNGLLHLLKKGLDVDDAHLTLMYPAPLASSAARVHENFTANIFSITRQVRYSQTNPLEEIDMVLFLNGMALITVELKNAWTGQTARFHGQKQYRDHRDATQPLLQFGRALVHMAVDTDEVFMASKLAGPATFFLPFNKGHNNGEGNPPNPNGHKTAYLWEEVFQPASLAGIIQHFGTCQRL
jgi:type I restriction enzyme R subunit